MRKKEEEELGGKHWVKEERRGLCAEGPDPRASHPEDLCSLAGWLQRRQRERKREEGRKRKKEREGGIAREDWA